MKRGAGAGGILLFTFGVVAGVAVGCAKGSDSGVRGDELDLNSAAGPGPAPVSEGGVAHPLPPPAEAGPSTPSCVSSDCPARPNATMACDMDGKCAIGSCQAQHADCNHDAADGCETDTGSDVSSCSACGSACPKPTNASATCSLGTCGFACSAGFAMLGTQCASFGGAYAVSDPGCPSCASANVIGGTCGCPAGFGAMTTVRLINDCSGLHGALLTFCAAPGLASGGDWAGAFELDDGVAGSLGCRVPNPSTSACTCPSGATPIAMRTIVDNSSTGALFGSTLTICLNQSAPTTSFGGAYQKDDPVAGNLGCRAPNPKTGACSCPAGTVARDHRTVADVPSGKIGTMISLCMP